MGESESVEQLSWLPLPFYPLLRVVRVSFVIFFLFTSLKVLMLAPRLPLLYGERITSTLLHVDFLLELAANDLTKVRVLALSCPESGAWLNALPLSSIGLKMDDDVIRIVVGLRLGLALCHLHSCSDCSAEVNEDGIHGKFELSLLQRLPFSSSALNNIVKRSLEATKIPYHLEPSGLYRSDGKRPDGASVVPWQRGNILVWDATCSDTCASVVPWQRGNILVWDATCSDTCTASHREIAVRDPGTEAAAVKHRKRSKYCNLDATHHFVPITVETLGVLGQDVRSFFREVARHVMAVTNESQSHQSLL